MKTAAILFLLNLFTVYAVQGQKKTDDAEAVYTNLTCEVVIRDVKGALSATRTISEDMILTTDNAAKMMSRGYIYHSSFNELKRWDAYTQVPSENKRFKVANTVQNSSTQNYIFYDDSKSTNFDFAGIQAGATRHIDYQLEHKDLHMLTPHYFDRYFPVRNGELKIVFPSTVKLRYVIKGLNADKVTFTSQTKKEKTIYTFIVKDLPGVQNYKDAPDDSYYATHVVFFVEQVEQDGQWKNYLSTVSDLFRYNYNFIKDINNTISPELMSITDSLTAGAKSDEEETRRIYKWVQGHIKYVAFEDGLEGFIPRPANLVCSRRFGDCKDMASILTAMLTYAGVPAYFTWIGTRDLPYSYAETPTTIVDNHMICAARINNQYVFLDGTDESCIYGMPAAGIQGKEALIALSHEKYEVVKVPVASKETNKITDSTFLQLKDKILTGKVKIKFTGYHASAMRSAINMRNDKEQDELFKNRFNRGSAKIHFTNWHVVDNGDADIEIHGDFTLPDYARKVGDDYLINLNLFKWYEHEEIDYPTRKIPISFSFLETCTYTTILQLPEGFKLNSLPQSQDFNNEVWGFKMQYKQGNGSILLHQQFDTDQLMLYPAQFEKWNQVLEKLFPLYKQSAVLSKN